MWNKADNQASDVTDLLRGFLPHGVSNVYEFYATRADSIYKAGNYTAALSDYKAAELLKGEKETVQFKLKKALCEELIALQNKAYDLYYVQQNYQAANAVYAEIIEKSPSDRYHQFMFNYSKPLKEQNYIKVPAGKFLMTSEEEFVANTVMEITVKEFQLSPYEVTNAQYVRFLNEYKSTTVKASAYAGQKMVYPQNGDANVRNRIYNENGVYKVEKGYELHPVIEVTWYGANEFCQHYGLRLPTEAEWEYAAGWNNESGTGDVETRRGVSLQYAGTNTESELPDYTWFYDNNTPYGTKPVGTKKPNPLGLYDMSGNVGEWCSSWGVSYGENYLSKAENCNDCYGKIIRGGDWGAINIRCRVSNRRTNVEPDQTTYEFGFRCVLSFDHK